jgi:hypothetical protein
LAQDGTNAVYPPQHPTSAVKKRVWVSWIRLRLRVLAGKIYNLAGVPGIVRDCDYAATAHDTRVQVKAGDLFTIISVNGLDIYFHRLTGSIDGIGFSGAPSSCTLDVVRGSVGLPEPSSLRRHNARKYTE